MNLRATNMIAVAAALGAIPVPSADAIGRMARRASKVKNRALPHQHNGGDPIRVKSTPGRNDKCPCSSGKKYKSCCANRPTLEKIVDVTMAEKVESRLQGDV